MMMMMMMMMMINGQLSPGRHSVEVQVEACRHPTTGLRPGPHCGHSFEMP